ncbi:HNH endonuclease [Bradyrhizobium sp. CIR3A]|uniref:HNH endonuclease n=1 Tax=Bradyrhizobium sp. CIR3A TaxID=2663838 RepID=UPI0016061632|nr:HNH endonuclease signature motif containing protein [Bradyrhizobium sp. CIR3A]MBB4263753.1 hypothetical protein [Bradyrhizobium sp. CIR3A]
MLDFRSRILLEKAARDAGFEIAVGHDDYSMTFASSLVKARLRIGVDANRFTIAVDESDVMNELTRYVGQKSEMLQIGNEAIEAPGILVVHELAERAFQLSRSMPTRPLDEFRTKLASSPSSTEIERMVRQRVGQDIFRKALDDYWQGKCAVTGISDRPLLRASHIVPWAECVSDEQRLDVFNGILLIADLDAVFDAALMTFDEIGHPRFSDKLSSEGRARLVDRLSGVSVRLAPRHQGYLAAHRARFKALSQAN